MPIPPSKRLTNISLFHFGARLDLLAALQYLQIYVYNSKTLCYHRLFYYDDEHDTIGRHSGRAERSAPHGRGVPTTDAPASHHISNRKSGIRTRRK